MGYCRMLSKLRVILAVLSLGFAIEGAIGAYTYLSRSYRFPDAALSRSDPHDRRGSLDASVA